MTHDAQTKGLFKELNPLFMGIRSLDLSLQRATAELTKEELVRYSREIEDIRSIISNSTKMDHLGHCKNIISDLLLHTLADRRNMKNIIFSL